MSIIRKYNLSIDNIDVNESSIESYVFGEIILSSDDKIEAYIDGLPSGKYSISEKDLKSNNRLKETIMVLKEYININLNDKSLQLIGEDDLGDILYSYEPQVDKYDILVDSTDEKFESVYGSITIDKNESINGFMELMEGRYTFDKNNLKSKNILLEAINLITSKVRESFSDGYLNVYASSFNSMELIHNTTEDYINRDVLESEDFKITEYEFNVEEDDYFYNSAFGKLKLLHQGVDMIDKNLLTNQDYVDSEYLENIFEIESENLSIVSEIEIPEGTYDPSDSFNNYGISKPSYYPLTVTGSILPSYIGKPSRNSDSVTLNDTLLNEYIPIINNISDINGDPVTIGLKLLVIVMAKHEGFEKGTKSYRTNNPGNIGNTDKGNTQKFGSLREGILGQLNFIKDIIKNNNRYFPVGKDMVIEPFYSPEIAKNQKGYGGMNPYLVGYKFKYTNQLNQFIKIYATGSRGSNSYLNEILSWFRINGYGWINEETTLEQIVEQTNDKNYIYKNIKRKNNKKSKTIKPKNNKKSKTIKPKNNKTA